MEAPCVRVRPQSGEETREALADAGVLDADLDITVDDGWLYLPVADPDGVPERFDVVTHDVPVREGQTMPADILGFEPSYERLGDVVILREDDPERAREIADAIVASDVKARTVVNEASKVKGVERTRDWDVLARADDADGDEGDADRSCTETVHREYGCAFELDVAEVYFSPRLATERHRVVEQVEAGEHAFDMFAGVGPFAIPMAKRDAAVVATDINPDAVGYLKQNARRNGVADRVTALCGDVRELADDYEGWADRVVMNLPKTASDFLDVAVELAGDECVLHLYDIQHEDDPFGPGETAIRDAAEPAYGVEIETEHVVRSYAPHELNVCIDARLTRL
ncbi:class I SAM-dependent methyltransferase [Halocalculus aciditolerans]|uniref:tRNA (Guanine-N1)-methyltransferase n=1 Tax=Halocalculus aciditolerans TaxID=1383812 RepID=A0A830F2M3_9EURY|nr:class I SAM-dependent methyltransferase family protein [Halocalculus aciditolerans]GGL56644.1 tRNA (guanine-N1)-methyltransferase [Halocalculus aciditolerans]